MDSMSAIIINPTPRQKAWTACALTGTIPPIGLLDSDSPDADRVLLTWIANQAQKQERGGNQARADRLGNIGVRFAGTFPVEGFKS